MTIDDVIATLGSVEKGGYVELEAALAATEPGAREGE